MTSFSEPISLVFFFWKKTNFGSDSPHSFRNPSQNFGSGSPLCWLNYIWQGTNLWQIFHFQRFPLFNKKHVCRPFLLRSLQIWCGKNQHAICSAPSFSSPAAPRSGPATMNPGKRKLEDPRQCATSELSSRLKTLIARECGSSVRTADFLSVSFL